MGMLQYSSGLCLHCRNPVKSQCTMLNSADEPCPVQPYYVTCIAGGDSNDALYFADTRVANCDKANYDLYCCPVWGLSCWSEPLNASFLPDSIPMHEVYCFIRHWHACELFPGPLAKFAEDWLFLYLYIPFPILLLLILLFNLELRFWSALFPSQLTFSESGL